MKFMKKLKFVKEKLRIWNRDVFGDTRIRKRDDIQVLDVLDKIESGDGLVEDHVLVD